ncbi:MULTISPECIES: hypothetical protein [Corallococcus]|uniref:hypothetical protein n=1 Tax=Corallococcus TaxID=83461 RepID=UPI0013767CF7|nr:MULTISPECIES: hypothetical protein [Corallococcus]NBD09770.1 hypothetical protein [Corallococcus silvisoli]
MSHDESTYLDEGRDYLDLGDEGESGRAVLPLQPTEDRRWGHLDEEAWGGWSVVE